MSEKKYVTEGKLKRQLHGLYLSFGAVSQLAESFHAIALVANADHQPALMHLFFERLVMVVEKIAAHIAVKSVNTFEFADVNDIAHF